MRRRDPLPERIHVKTETVQHEGREVVVTSHHSTDELSGFTIIDFEARCGERLVRSRMTVGGAEDHGLHVKYDLAQFEKDHADHTRHVASLAESRHRAGSFAKEFAKKHEHPEPSKKE